MSTIIAWDVKAEKQRINIYAPDCRTRIESTDIIDFVIHIDGDAEKPFIHSVRFKDCYIIAENLLAFDNCYFDKSCTMLVKNMPIANGCQSINLNYVISSN